MHSLCVHLVTWLWILVTIVSFSPEHVRHAWYIADMQNAQLLNPNTICCTCQLRSICQSVCPRLNEILLVLYHFGRRGCSHRLMVRHTFSWIPGIPWVVTRHAFLSVCPHPSPVGDGCLIHINFFLNPVCHHRRLCELIPYFLFATRF